MRLIDADIFLSKIEPDEYYHTNEIMDMVTSLHCRFAQSVSITSSCSPSCRIYAHPFFPYTKFSAVSKFPSGASVVNLFTAYFLRSFPPPACVGRPARKKV